MGIGRADGWVTEEKVEFRTLEAVTRTFQEKFQI